MEIELDIHSLSRAGSGVGRDAAGRVVFVPFTAPGDRIRALILSEEKRYAEGKLLELISPSPQRVEPRCPVFGICGGCEWQHLPYSLQWETKKNGVLHALQRVGISMENPDCEEFPAQEIWEYRNRIQLRGQKEEVGFLARRSKNLVPIENCAIARPEINAWISEVRSQGKEKHRPYKAEIEVFPDGVVAISWNRPHGALGFRQVHDEQNRKLQSWVSKQLGGQTLLDLYGGSGNLSIGLCDQYEEVHCVDFFAPEQQRETDPKNFFPHRGSILSWMKSMEHNLSPNSAIDIILDPPREGLGSDLAPLVEIFLRLPVRKIVFVGCDPDSWARGIARFQKYGWSIKKLGTLDFFPQTHHVEALAVLEKSEKTTLIH